MRLDIGTKYDVADFEGQLRSLRAAGRNPPIEIRLARSRSPAFFAEERAATLIAASRVLSDNLTVVDWIGDWTAPGNEPSRAFGRSLAGLSACVYSDRVIDEAQRLSGEPDRPLDASAVLQDLMERKRGELEYDHPTNTATFCFLSLCEGAVTQFIPSSLGGC